MSNAYERVSDLLADLSGHGVYDIAIINNEMGKFGFSYDPNTTTLKRGDTEVRVFVGTPGQIRRSMEADPKGGILEDVPEDIMLIDALELAEAIVKSYGETPAMPFHGRGRNYRFLVDQIRVLEDKEGNDARTDDPTQG